VISRLNKQNLTLNDIVLLASMELSEGDVNHAFTAEELLLKSWEIDKHAFGLRGYENDHPDSNILYTKLMGKLGLVRTGYLKKIGEKTYTITEAGLSIASAIRPISNETKIKIERRLYEIIIKIINHQIFIKWLESSGEEPKKFRDAMWFWGIAPGTPPKIAKGRISVIELSLQEAKKLADASGGKIAIDSKGITKENQLNLSKYNVTSMDESKAHTYLDVLDIERCLEFHNALKKRFENDLKFILKED
jgi:hypothetical protein